MTTEELLHPFLSFPAATFNRWLGRDAFHAGAFCAYGKVWALVGPPGAGKTSTLVALHQLQIPIFTDDMLVLDRALAFAGPRCIDLREDAAGFFRLGDALGRVGSRDRWRLALGHVEPALPFGGWIGLTWSETAGMRRLPPSELYPLIRSQDALGIGPTSASWLDLMAFPAIELARPPGLTHLPGMCADLLSRLREL